MNSQPGFLIRDDETNKVLSISSNQIANILNKSITLKGPTGSIGPTGEQGLIGSQGPTGIQGSIGPTGPIGPVGTQGVEGAAGESIIGNTGDIGIIGIQGIQGPQGVQGTPTIGDVGDSPIGLIGEDGGGVDLYVDLSDTPANFSDINQALVVNSAGTGVTHTSLRTRIASSNSTVLSSDYATVLSSSAGTCSGKYSFIGSSSDAQNKATNTCTSVISCTNCQANTLRSSIIGSDGCQTISGVGTNNCSILGCESCSLSGGSSQMTLQSNNSSISGSSYSSIISSSSCTSVSSDYSTIISSDQCDTSKSNTTILSSFLSDTKANFSTIIGGKNCNTYGNYSFVSSSYNCDASGNFSFIAASTKSNTSSGGSNSALFSSDTCNINGKNSVITASNTCIINTGCSYDVIMSCKDCSMSSSNKFSFLSSSLNSTITNNYAAINASNNCTIAQQFNRIVASGNCSINSSPSNHNFIFSCDNCDISTANCNRTSFIASSDSTVNSSTVNNSIILASSNCNLSNASQMAIIGCDNVTCSANNAAIIGCQGITYNNNTSYSVVVRQIRANTFTMKVSDIRDKKNVEVVEMNDDQILEKVAKLPVSEFKLKRDSNLDKVKRGFIAQEAQQIFPEIVVEDNLNYQKVYRADIESNEWFTDINLTNKVEDDRSIEVNGENSLIGMSMKKNKSEYLSIDNGELTSLIFKVLHNLKSEYRQKHQILTDLIKEKNKKYSKNLPLPKPLNTI